MREILFRGKHVSSGKWIISPSIRQEADGSVYLLVKRTWYCVDPETVGQYTGLTDKNGKKIFEGDILEWDIEEWKAKGTNHGYRDVVKWDYELFDTRETDWKEYCKVIGNVHDDPELLEVAE